MQDFLKKVNVTNTFPLPMISYPPCTIENFNIHHNISYDSSLQLFSLCSGEISDDGYTGRHINNIYYFRFHDFFPIVTKLMEFKSVMIHHPSIYIFTSSRYNHTYDFFDEDYLSLSEGIAQGELHFNESYCLHLAYCHDLSSFTKHFHGEKKQRDTYRKLAVLRCFGGEAFSRRVAASC